MLLLCERFYHQSTSLQHLHEHYAIGHASHSPNLTTFLTKRKKKMPSAAANAHLKYPPEDRTCGKRQFLSISKVDQPASRQYLKRILSANVQLRRWVFPCSQDVEENVTALSIAARGSHQLALLVNVWHCGKSSAWCHPDQRARSKTADESLKKCRSVEGTREGFRLGISN